MDGTGWHYADENVAFLPILQEAIWQERKVQLTYHLSTGPIVKPLLDPLGLVAKGSVWYLLAVFEGRVCVYRVSRVQEARMTAQRCVRPKEFDLTAFWEQSSAEFMANHLRCPAVVRAAPAIVPQVRSGDGFARIEQVDSPGAEGWVSICMQFETQEQACAYVLRFGTRIEVVEPQALRQGIIQIEEDVAELYGQRPGVRP